MKLVRKGLVLFPVFYPVYDDSEGSEGDAGKAAAEGGAGSGTPTPEKKFSQSDVDRIIKERFKNERTKNEQLVAQLRTVQEQGLTPDARATLEEQIKALEESMMTKEQLAAKGLAETENKYKKTLAEKESEAAAWRSRYERSTIERSLADAGAANGALSAEQLVMMFGNSTRLVQQAGSDGKLTDSFLPVMKFTGVDAEKKPTTMELPVAEAIAHMRENGLHSNLFRHEASPGTGKAGSGGSEGDKAHREPQPEDYKTTAEYGAAYQKWRNNHDVDGRPLTKK